MLAADLINMRSPDTDGPRVYSGFDSGPRCARDVLVVWNRPPSVGEIRAADQDRTDDGRHPAAWRVADRQVRLQGTDQVKNQAGERPLLESSEPWNQNHNNAERLGRPEEGQ